MPTHQPSRGPFFGYRVTLAPDVPPSLLKALRTAQLALLRVVASHGQPVTVPAGHTASLYEAARLLADEAGAPFPLRFKPVRPPERRPRPIEAEPLPPGDILHLVHDGFFGAERCREAAIAAVAACGAHPVPALHLAAVHRGSPRAHCERHVDTLIEREPELHLPRAVVDGTAPMKLQCAQEALADALAMACRIVPNKSTLPVLANVLLQAERADELRVTSTNLELTVSRRIRANVTAGGRTTAPAQLLADYVALLDRGKQVSLTLAASGTRLHLACERHEANATTLPAEDFPPPPTVAGGTRVEVDSSALRKAIQHVLFAAAPDDSRPVLAGVLLSVDDATLTLTASDGYRMAMRTIDLPGSNPTAAWIVPSRTLRELSRCLPTGAGVPVTLSGTTSDHQLHVALPEIELTSRLIEGQFPDVQRIIPQTTTTSVILGTADLLRATLAASVFARASAHAVRLECNPPPDDGTPALGRVLVRGATGEIGDHLAQLDASVQGQTAQIALNGRYLRDALEVLDSPQVALGFSGGLQPGVLRPVGELEATHLQLIMPMHDR